MFSSLLPRLRDLREKFIKDNSISEDQSQHGPSRRPMKAVPQSPEELRLEIIDEALKKIHWLGVPKTRDYKKFLESIRVGATVPFQEVLLIVSYMYSVVIHIYYGEQYPVIYIYRHQSIERKSDRIVYLQCLAGIHYNLLRAIDGHIKFIQKPEEEVELNKLNSDIIEDVKVLWGHEPSSKQIFCNHSFGSTLTAVLQTENMSLCTLIDSGAQVCVIKRSVIDNLRQCQRAPTQLRI